MSQLSTFYPNLITAADIGVGTASNVTFASLQNTPIGSTTPNTGVFTALTAPAYNMTSGGAVVLGASPTTTAVGTGAINIQASRTAATQVASFADSIAIGNRSTSSSTSTIAIGAASNASQSGATVVGERATSTTAGGIAIGSQASATNDRAVTIGEQASCSAQFGISVGAFVGTTGVNAVSLNAGSTLRAQFSTLPFRAVYWGGTTTDATANVELFLDATSPNRLTIANDTALVADILIIGNSTTSSKAYWASRRVAIRKVGTGNVSLIGAVEGTESGSTASTPWSFTIDADTTNQALRIRVTGEASTSITWRATAFYRLV